MPLLQVEILAKQILKAPVEIQVGGRSVVNKDITQYVEIRLPEDRFMRLLELLGEWTEQGKVLVFVNSQEQCDKLFRDLLQVPSRQHAWQYPIPWHVRWSQSAAPRLLVQLMNSRSQCRPAARMCGNAQPKYHSLSCLKQESGRPEPGMTDCFQQQHWAVRAAMRVVLNCGQKGHAVTDRRNPNPAPPFVKSA